MPAPHTPERSGTAWLTGVLALGALASLGRFWNGTAWDDDLLLGLTAQLVDGGRLLLVFAHSTLGQVLERTGDAGSGDLDLYRPLSLASFALDYALAGKAPLLYHATNLALHLGCTALVFVIARQLLGSGRTQFAALAAAWFAVSPHLAEAHVWISGRFDEVAGLFGLLSVWLLLRAHRAEGPRLTLLAASGVACLLSLLGKEAFVFALPALAFLPTGAETRLRTRVLRVAPCVMATLVYGALRLNALHGAGTGVAQASDVLRALAYWPLVAWDAALGLLVPMRVYSRMLSEDYAVLPAWVLVAAAGGSLVVAVLAVRARKTLPVFSWSLLWLWCTVAPITLIATRAWPGFGRFLYLPATMFFIGVAELLAVCRERFPRYAGLFNKLLPTHLAILSLGLAAYAGDFANDDTLFGSIIAAAPDRSHGYGYLGISYVERHRYDEAAVLLRKADELSPNNRRYMQPLAKALLFGGHRADALALADRAIAKLDTAPEFHLLAAYALLDEDPKRAATEVLACLREDLPNAECRDALAFLVTKHPRAATFREQFTALRDALPTKDAALKTYVQSVL